MNRQQIFKLTSIFLGILVGLIFSEAAYRFCHYLNFENLNQIKNNQQSQINDLQHEKSLGQVIRLASEKKIVYEFISNSSFKFQNVTVTTNKDGFRDKNYPLEKKDTTIRMIGLGDSVMFGWGVEEGICYLDQLETSLNLSYDVDFEVINTAVPGYNTVMEVETLKKKINLSSVDWVIINFVNNDLDLPNFIQKKPNYWTLKKSMILQLFEPKFTLDSRLKNSPFDGKNQRYERSPNKVPADYINLVGEQSCIDALEELKNLGTKFGFKIIFLSHSPYYSVPPNIKEKVNEFEFIFINMHSFWQKYKLKNPTAKWKIAENDFHPSIEAHTLISEVLFDEISKRIKQDKPVFSKEK